ncbi:MAG: RidA family protein [Gemmatimonadetes bacterium]|nr:RidA family protein [Gemmatimonadota bacterium]
MRRSSLTVAALLVTLVAPLLAAQDAKPSKAATKPTGGDPEYIHPYGPPTRPFSPVVRVGNLLFLAGQVGTGPNAAGGVVPGGISAETRQVMENIKELLGKVGSSMDKVVKCTVFLADMKEWDAMNEVYKTYFSNGRFPARSAIGTSGLALNARVEIECIATK